MNVGRDRTLSFGQSRPFTPALLCVSFLLGVAGCSNEPFDIVTVSGTVMYEDGSPIPSDDYRLKFVPQIESPDGKAYPRVATAMIGADGSFSKTTTHKYGDGLAYGKHLVYLKIGKGPDGKPLVPAEYLSSKTTPLEIDVSQSRQLEIRVPKP